MAQRIGDILKAIFCVPAKPLPRPRCRYYIRWAPGEPWDEWPECFEPQESDLFEGEALARVEVME